MDCVDDDSDYGILRVCDVLDRGSKMTSKDMRAEFEKWYYPEDDRYREPVFQKKEGEYIVKGTYDAWEAWKAATEAAQNTKLTRSSGCVFCELDIRVTEEMVERATIAAMEYDKIEYTEAPPVAVKEYSNQMRLALAAALDAPKGVDDEPDIFTCPSCGGEADNGFDRCYPPNPYACTKCDPDVGG